MNEAELREQSRRFLELLSTSLQASNGAANIDGPAWAETRAIRKPARRSRI